MATLEDLAIAALATGKALECGNRERVSAMWIADLLAGRVGKAARHAKGLTLTGASLTGQAQWAHDRFTVRFALIDCTFEEPLLAGGLRVAGDASFEGCRFRSLDLKDARVDGDLNLANVTVRNGQGNDPPVSLNLNSAIVSGTLHLQGARVCGETNVLGGVIGGSFECGGARFQNAGGNALVADRVKVTYSVLLDKRFTAHGDVRFIEAKIGGQFVCRDGTFSMPDGDALSLHSAKIEGSAFLDDGFNSTGRVRMLETSIGGQLICCNARFTAADGHALVLQSAVIGGKAFLADGFCARGSVSLVQTEMRGGLDCSAGRFLGAPVAIDAEGLRVLGRFQFKPAERPSGTINLRNAQVAQLCDELKCWPAPRPGMPVIDLTGFTYGQFGDGAETEVAARVSWIRSQTSGDYAPQPYLQLASVYQQEGMDYERRRVLIAKQNDLRQFGRLRPWERAWNWLLKVLTGYGHQAWRALIAIALVYGLSVGVVWLAKDHNGFTAVGPTADTLVGPGVKDPITANTCHSYYPCLSQFIYPADAAIPVINLHQSEYWAFDASVGSWGSWARYIFDALTLSGWFFSSLLIAALAGLIRND